MMFFEQMEYLKSISACVAVEHDANYELGWSVEIRYIKDDKQIQIKKFAYKHNDCNLETLWKLTYDDFITMASHGVQLRIKAEV